MMECNSRDGIAKLLVAFEKELHQCVSQDLLSLLCSYFLENFMKFPSISTKTISIVIPFHHSIPSFHTPCFTDSRYSGTSLCNVLRTIFVVSNSITC